MERKIMYVNSAAVASSAYDCDIKFSTQCPAVDSNNSVEVDSIDIVMSIQHAKVLLIALNSQIQAYENIYGAVDISKIVDSNS